MTPFRFVHCADLHIDSPFEGVRGDNAEVAARLREATFAAFSNVIDLCLAERVDALLIAGDVFDSADRSLRAQLHFRNELARLAGSGIPAFVAHGNHDPLDGWTTALRFPDDVTVFPGDRVDSIPLLRDGELLAQVHGISFPTRNVRQNLAKLFQRSPGAPFNISVLHCNVGDTTHESYAQCTTADLQAAEMDYWALGHVHERRDWQFGSRSAVYPGNTQGRSIRERGERGCVLVTVNANGQTSLQFHSTDLVRWQTADVDARTAENVDDLQATVATTCEHLREQADGRPVMTRIRLTGATEAHAALTKEGARNDFVRVVREEQLSLHPWVWIERLELATRPPIDFDALLGRNDFVGEVLQVARAAVTDDALRRELVTELAKLFDHRRARQWLNEPDAAQVDEWLREAEVLLLDQLVVEG